MQPYNFPGSVKISPLKGVTNEKYLETWAAAGKDSYGNECIVVAWKPSYEDLQALNRGEPVYINITGQVLPSMTVFTLNEDGYSNDPGLDEENNAE